MSLPQFAVRIFVGPFGTFVVFAACRLGVRVPGLADHRDLPRHKAYFEALQFGSSIIGSAGAVIIAGMVTSLFSASVDAVRVLGLFCAFIVVAGFVFVAYSMEYVGHSRAESEGPWTIWPRLNRHARLGIWYPILLGFGIMLVSSWVVLVWRAS